ncbi:hypothetical protein WJ74_16375 [Burkholderia ubonensis]|nr:hypothetical protein WJ74_16375 [Burkholderia ubonensis]
MQAFPIVIAFDPIDDIQADVGARCIVSLVDSSTFSVLKKLSIGALLSRALARRLMETFILSAAVNFR